MTLAPLLQSAPAIQIHVVAICGAVALTFVQLFGVKGAIAHRISGYLWAACMLAAAVSSFFIHTIRLIGPFSPIHILSIITLIGVPSAVLAARRHQVAKHKSAMLSVVVLALGGAGAFALFVPGRIMFQVLFGG